MLVTGWFYKMAFRSFHLTVIAVLLVCFEETVICRRENGKEMYKIGQLNVYEDKITLSGFSAGASMAIQTHMAHSSLFKGLGIFSQAFYHCGPRSLIEFGVRCSKYGLGLFQYNVATSINDAKKFAKLGLIDPLQNLAEQRIFIWTGALDAYVPSEMAAKNVEFYQEVGVKPENVKFTLFKNASHLIPTNNFGPPCDADAGAFMYLGNCNYSGPYYALQYILNQDSLLEDSPDPEQLKEYNQSVFYPFGNIRDVAMGNTGFIYIPKRCEAGQQCLLHLNFHGCNEWPPEIAEQYILNSGYLPIAEGNDIIMVFPLTTKVPQNMDGCWDFFSYTGTNFATKKGAQIQVVQRILHRILHGQ